MPKQVRFTQLVKAAGKPHAATLWVSDPKADPDFKRAIDDNRIVTVHNVNVGSKKDSGEIGFKKGAGFTYIIFPKALPFGEGSKVIGLKFDMLADVPARNAVRVKEAKRNSWRERMKTVKEPNVVEFPKPEKKSSRAEEKLPLPRFKVTLEFTAVATRQMEVQAKNATEAIRLATAQAEDDLPEPEWKIEADDVKKCD